MYPGIGLSRWCKLFGYSRQAFYQQLWSHNDKNMEEQIVIKLVYSIRSEQPRIGVRKLQIMLEEELNKASIKIGRDALFDLLAREGLLVKKRKRKYPQTTNSTGWFRKYKDLTIGFAPLQTNRLWVADITYIPMVTEGFSFLSLLTDTYSHQIIGWSLQETLATDGPLEALKQALKKCKPIAGLIHHSDRGTQYRSIEYVKLLQDYGADISMTQSGDPRENAIAERVNGIIKNELLEEKVFSSFLQATQQIRQAVLIYNEKRPHASCQMLTPNQASTKKGILLKKWKSTKTSSMNN
jgi:putative transposase